MASRAAGFALVVGTLFSTGIAAAEPRPESGGEASAGIIPLGPPAWLGVTMDAGGDTGVRVEKVVRGSPADRAGVKVGDRIVAIEGARVTQPAHVSRTVTAHKVFDRVALSLDRTGSSLQVSVVLAARPSGDEILRMDLVGAAAPAWINVVPLVGAPPSLAGLKGRVVLVDFWASWCGPCRLLAPRLSSLKNRFAAQGLSVVGITTDDAEHAATFAEAHRMTYPSVIDRDGDTSKAYGITGLPTMLLIDKKGLVREVFVGFDPSGEARVETAIKALLAEPAPHGAAAGPNAPPPSVPRPDPR